MTPEQIKEINAKCPYEQGIFTEPYGAPHGCKEPLVYMRWETGGVSGGSCWDDSNPQRYTSRKGKPNFTALDLTLKMLRPNLTFLEYKEIESLIESTEYTEWEYYGNCTDYNIQYIKLSKLERFLASLD